MFFFDSNLIQPPGMMLRPAVFSLRVFRAEDIPQSKFLQFIFFECQLKLACHFARITHIMIKQNPKRKRKKKKKKKKNTQDYRETKRSGRSTT